MALSIFDDKSAFPSERELSAVLGRASALWKALHAHIASVYQPFSEKWNFPGKNYGWGLQLIQKKRTVLYMTPQKGYFIVSFALGEKAVQAAHQSGLRESVMSVIDAAPRYAEGRGVRLEVRSKKDLESIKKLAAIKMAS